MTTMSKRAKRTKTKTTQGTITRCARQGDVLLLRHEGPEPSKATELPREGGSVILAHGEVTGHAHRIADPGVCLLRAEGVAHDLLRVVEGVVDLVHEEHATIRVGPGLYERRIQREHSWNAEAEEVSRAVAD
jgi:hypothetical protein